MANIDQIIVVALLFAVLLIAISVTGNHKRKSVNDEGLPRFLLFAYSYIAGIISYIMVYLLARSGSNARYMFLLVIWCSYCAILAAMVMQSVFIFDYDKIWIKNITAILCYYSMFSVLVELIFQRFTFDSNSSGILFTPGFFSEGFYYGFPIILYYICMIFLLVNYNKTHTKVRERHLIGLCICAIVPSLFGLVLESVCQVIFNLRYPVFFLIMIIPLKLMSDIHIKNRSFMLKLCDFERLLKADNTDAVFICNDEQVVLYQNKAAEVNSQMYSDEYIGRKLSEIFIIDRDVLRAMNSNDAKDGLMVPALYPITQHQIIMSIEFIYDCCNEILCYIITIPNYLVAVDESLFEGNDKSNDMSSPIDVRMPVQTEKPENPHATQDSTSVDPNANILVVDDNLEKLDQYEEMLKAYGITVTRAIGGRAAIEMILDPCYDAVFISYKMAKLNGIETAKRIRSMGGSYYSDIPIIFILDEPVALIYKDLLSVSFNDYIETPISVSKLNVIMGRWLWRRYAVTDKFNVTVGSSRSIRYIAEMSELYEDCLEFTKHNKWDYIGYTLKGIKRLCSRLEDKKLTDACDNMLDVYIRGQNDQIAGFLDAFKVELERVKSNASQGLMY